MKRLLQIGAGNIGRGYMAQLFHEAGWEVTFADAVPEIVDALNAAGTYPLRVLDAYAGRAREIEIGPISAVHMRDAAAFREAVARADAIGTAVGVPNLPRIAPALADALLHRRATHGTGVDIFLCENTLTAGRDLEGAVRAAIAHEPASDNPAQTSEAGAGAAPAGAADAGAADARVADGDTGAWITQHVGFVGTSVARMVPVVSAELRRERPLLVIADAYRPLPYDAQAVRNEVPDLPELSPRSDFAVEVQRKLFLYNMLHASLAYLGAERGLTYVHETLLDRDARALFLSAGDEISRALELAYPHAITRPQNEAILSDVLVRYGNPMLEDSIARVGRDPLRKLGSDDRLVGAARLCLAHGIEPRAIVRIAAAAFAYRNPDDPSAVELEALTTQHDVSARVSLVTGEKAGSQLHGMIVSAIEERSAS